MSIEKQHYGNTGTQDVMRHTLTNDHGMSVSFIDYGARITAINVPDAQGQMANVVLSLDSLADYMADGSYLGAICGRTAGRIGEASFTLDGKTHHLTANNGKHTLHGGATSFSHVVWEVIESGADANKAFVTFSYVSPHGEEGYPGTLKVGVTYTLDNKNQLTTSYRGVTDRPTIVDLTNHSYFNLSGDPTQTIFDHHLQVESDAFCELDPELIPTGNMISLDEFPPFDYRDGKYISPGIDHPFWLAEDQDQIILTHPASGRSLIIDTDTPGVVIYTGNMMPEAIRHTAICLETQGLPNAINCPEFPEITLYPEETYQTRTTYKFDTI